MAQEQKGNHDMAANSANSPANGKNSTKRASQKRRREPLSKTDALEILMAALNECIDAGLEVFILRSTDGEPLISITGADVVGDEGSYKIVPK
ncbi:MAG TPA: hypothetical protein PKY60_11000 [Thermoflexales bacterium]|nr:hypothetical protein [Thermoflexales bacterium]